MPGGFSWWVLVPSERFELPSSGLEGRCSVPWATKASVLKKCFSETTVYFARWHCCHSLLTVPTANKCPSIKRKGFSALDGDTLEKVPQHLFFLPVGLQVVGGRGGIRTHKSKGAWFTVRGANQLLNPPRTCWHTHPMATLIPANADMPTCYIILSDDGDNFYDLCSYHRDGQARTIITHKLFVLIRGDPSTLLWVSSVCIMFPCSHYSSPSNRFNINRDHSTLKANFQEHPDYFYAETDWHSLLATLISIQMIRITTWLAVNVVVMNDDSNVLPSMSSLFTIYALLIVFYHNQPEQSPDSTNSFDAAFPLFPVYGTLRLGQGRSSTSLPTLVLFIMLF